MDVSGDLHVPAGLLADKNPSTHWIGGWVGPGPQIGYGYIGNKKNMFNLPEFKPRTIQLVA
jgi:hypothetical protein